MEMSITDDIAAQMRNKTSEELIGIWTKNDRTQWSDAAFEAVRHVLTEREIPLPQQDSQHSQPQSETLVSLWHSWLLYDWRVLCVTDESIHLTYLGSPNPLLAFFPVGGIIMQIQARSRYRCATEIPVAQRIQSHPKNMTLNKVDILHIKGTSRKISITTKHGKIYKLVRMGDGDLMSMTSRFTPD
jgi:hypothetical protein